MDASTRHRARVPGTNRVRGRGSKRDGGVEVFRPKVWLREVSRYEILWYDTFQRFGGERKSVCMYVCDL